MKEARRSSGLADERERLEAHPAGGRAVRKEKVRHFHETIFGFHHIGLDLRSQAGATANEHPFEPVLGRDFQIDCELFDKLDGVVHGVASRPKPEALVQAVFMKLERQTLCRSGTNLVEVQQTERMLLVASDEDHLS
jgi:hypothetical protein